MKQLIPFFLFLFLTLQIQAQCDLTAEPNPYVETFLVDFSNPTAETSTHGYFINTSTETVNVKWEIIVDSDCPNEWSYKLCDANNCYIYGVLTNMGGPVNVPVKLDPGDTSILQFYIKPNAVSGCCKPKIELTCLGGAGVVSETAEFDVCVENATDVSEREKSSLRIFPNPSNSYFSLTNNNFIKKVWVSNILGKRVRSFYAVNDGRYDVSGLPDGIYLVSMVDEFNKVLKTVRMSKRNIRP